MSGPAWVERYRATHGRDGYALGSHRYPDNREGRRAMARSWKGAPEPRDEPPRAIGLDIE